MSLSCFEALIPPESLIIDFAVPHVSEDVDLRFGYPIARCKDAFLLGSRLNLRHLSGTIAMRITSDFSLLKELIAFPQACRRRSPKTTAMSTVQL